VIEVTGEKKSQKPEARSQKPEEKAKAEGRRQKAEGKATAKAKAGRARPCGE
jgi:hypothetical protein